MNKLTLLLFCLFALTASSAAQPVWNKKIDQTLFSIPFCHLSAEGDRFLVSTNNDFIELDQLGRITGQLQPTSGQNAFFTSVLKKQAALDGRPYFIIAKRTNTITKDFILEAYRPGEGFVQSTYFSDSLGSLGWLRPQLIDLPNNTFIVFGRSFYRKIAYSETTGFTEIWSRPLDLPVTAVLLSGNQFILTTEEGQVLALDQDGNTLWSKGHNLKFRALKALADGFIACGRTADNRAAAIKLMPDGTAAWSKTYPDKEFFDIIPAAGGGLAATGVSASDSMVLVNLSEAGETSWRRNFGPGGGSQLLQAPDGGYVLAGRVNNRLKVVRTDSNGIVPAEKPLALNQEILNTKSIQTTIIPSPTLFFNGIADGLISLADSGATTLKAFSPWIAGLDSQEQLYLAAADYAPYSAPDYRSGLAHGAPDDFKRVWAVHRAEIRQLRLDFGVDQDLDEPVPADLLYWPGKGNPYLKFNTDFTPVETDPDQFPAPFVDANGDGIYNVYDGDYPAIKGDHIIWWMLTDSTRHPHSKGQPLIVDLFISAYTYDCAPGNAVDRTLFVDYTLINRSGKAYKEMYLGFFTDPDLGCYLDDNIGTLPDANTWYVYNGNALDGNCAPGFGANIPVQTISFMNQSLDHALYNNNPGFANPEPPLASPDIPVEFYNFLKGLWKDGKPMTKGGTGYNPGSTNYTNYTFPDNPPDPQGWSMCTANLPLADRRFVSSHGPFSFAAADTFHLQVAFVLHPDIPHPCPDVFGLVKPAVTQLQTWNDAGAIDLTPEIAPVYTLAPGQSLSLDATVPQATYAWSTGATTPAITLSATGTYSVTITGATGCTHAEATVIQMGLGAGGQATGPQWRTWPNPATDQVHVQFEDGGSTEIVASLFDAQGRLIKRMSGPASGFNLPVKELPAGLYWLEIQNENYRLGGQKIVVQH